jgi:hypothetical protein
MKNKPVTWNRCRRKNHQVEQGHIQYIATWIELGSATKNLCCEITFESKDFMKFLVKRYSNIEQFSNNSV